MPTTHTVPTADPITLGDDLVVQELRAAVAGRRRADVNLSHVQAVLVQRGAVLERLIPSQARNSPGAVASQIVHAEAGFSVVALTLPPATQTAVHDHLTWCVVAVVRGCEHETTYRDHGGHLEPLSFSANPAGSVSVLTPPGDIHRVRNDADATASSIHVYGADLRLAGSSVRRIYDLPIRNALLEEIR